MGISYNADTKKWNIVEEKTDHDTSRVTDAPVQNEMKVWAIMGSYYLPGRYTIGQPGYLAGFEFSEKQPAKTALTNPQLIGTLKVNYTNQDLQSLKNQANAYFKQNNIIVGDQSLINGLATDASDARSRVISLNKPIEESNARNAELNELAKQLNEENAKKNEAYNQTVAIASSTTGGDYVDQRERIRQLQGIDDNTKELLEESFKNFYRSEKLQQWDSSLGAKPAYGDFDPNYYKTQNPELQSQWQKAASEDDIDITERYGENNFYLQHYTQQGKALGLRGNEAEKLKQAETYIERVPTDSELQAVRDLQLGVDTSTQTSRLLAIPEIAAQFEKAKQGDEYWKDLGSKTFLDPTNPDQFAALFRLSTRPEDKQVAFQYNANTGYGITQLEDAINQAVGEKATVDVKRFGALTQSVLRDTIEEMKKAKAKESTLAMLQGIDSFKEVMDINSTLKTDLLGDMSIGGIMPYGMTEKQQESFDKSLENITGINNLTTYNWQQWFDSKLKEKYDEDIELGYTSGEAKEQLKITGEFARDFIDNYLTPRFNQSKSMDEFVEYLDVQSKEQNPFQTQDMLSAVQLTADLRAKQYLDSVQKDSNRYFDPEFYFNPSGDKYRQDEYAKQSQEVAEDWEAAKAGDPYWAAQAYRYGVNPEDKEAFAKLHYQVKGRLQGYDAAEDILNAGKVEDEIYNKILPSLQEEALKQGSVFGQFITPESFAEQMTKGLDPTNKESWNKILEINGLTGFKGTLDELKEQISEALRGSSAAEVRARIEELNKLGEKPTQENVGITYIQRDTDYTGKTATGSTALYQTFKNAGYKGTEDEFYTNFFPDTDRAEQEFLTKSGSKEGLQLVGFNTTDPFESLSSLSSFMGEDQDKTTTTYSSLSKTKTPNYFNLNLLDEDETSKSKSGQDFLSEFTSLFK